MNLQLSDYRQSVWGILNTAFSLFLNKNRYFSAINKMSCKFIIASYNVIPEVKVK